jgi:hypothetical protein
VADGASMRAMAGVVGMKHKSVPNDEGTRVYREYEIDTGIIEALNSVERRAAIETGQEQKNDVFNELQPILNRTSQGASGPWPRSASCKWADSL